MNTEHPVKILKFYEQNLTFYLIYLAVMNNKYSMIIRPNLESSDICIEAANQDEFGRELEPILA